MVYSWARNWIRRMTAGNPPDNYVPEMLTELQPREATRFVAEAFWHAWGVRPTALQLAILVAQSALETGNWGKMHNWNFGNMRPGSQWKGRITTQDGADEVVAGRRVTFAPGDWKNNPFRAYGSPEEGSQDFVRFVMARTKAWTGVLNGDPVEYSLGLKAHGYYTADEFSYTAGVRRLVKQYLPVCVDIAEELGHEIGNAERQRIAGLVALTLSESGDPEPPAGAA